MIYSILLKNNAIHPWEQRKLGETLSLLKDGTHGTHKNVDDGYYLLSAKNIKNGKVLMFDDDRKISKDEYSLIHRNFVLKDKDVLITIVGSIGQSALYRLKEPVTFQRSVAYLRPKLFSSEYLYWIINTPMFKKKLQASQTLSAQPGIYLSDLSSITINYTTNFKEENKIVQLLNFINKTIELHQRKLINLNAIKKLFLLNLFPGSNSVNPKIRFNLFYENWQQRKLSEICSIVMGQSPHGETYTNNPNDKILIQGNADLKDGKVIPRIWTNQVTKSALKGDIIISVRAPVGDIAITQYNAVIGRGVAKITGNKFIYYTLMNIKYRKVWKNFLLAQLLITLIIKT